MPEVWCTDYNGCLCLGVGGNDTQDRDGSRESSEALGFKFGVSGLETPRRAERRGIGAYIFLNRSAHSSGCSCLHSSCLRCLYVLFLASRSAWDMCGRRPRHHQGHPFFPTGRGATPSASFVPLSLTGAVRAANPAWPASCRSPHFSFTPLQADLSLSPPPPLPPPDLCSLPHMQDAFPWA